MRLVTIHVLIACGLGPAAIAQPAPDAFDICARQQDSTARLACFDQQIAARRAANSASAAAPAKPVPSTPESTVGLDAQQLHKLHPDSVNAVPVIVEAKVVAVIARRPLISAFELDNGQVWEQTESVDGLWIKPRETVTIREGTMGGFLLKSADGHVARVKRVK
jgi:hypothetical protein